MCTTINRNIAPIQNTNAATPKRTKIEPLNLDLPKEFPSEMSLKDETHFSLPPGSSIKYPSVPIFQDPNDKSKLRLTESSPNSAKIEYGNPGEKAFITVKARNEVRTNGIYIETQSKASFDSPYLRDKAKEAVMDTVVQPVRDSLGKTAGDAALGIAAVATATVASKHIGGDGGSLKVNLPAKKLTGDEGLSAKLIVGYGDKQSLRPTGVEVRKQFEYMDQDIDIKASIRKDAKVYDLDGTKHKNVTKAQIEATITDVNRTETSGVLSMRAGYDEVSGASAGIFFSKKF